VHCGTVLHKAPEEAENAAECRIMQLGLVLAGGSAPVPQGRRWGNRRPSMGSNPNVE
jgi:hypothetical protein